MPRVTRMISRGLLAAEIERQTENTALTDAVVQWFPRILMAVGIAMALWSIGEFREAGRTSGWRKERGRVQAAAKAGEQVSVVLDDGRQVTVENILGRRLKANSRMHLMVDPADPQRARLRPAKVTPMAGAVIRLVGGLFIAGVGFVLQIVLSALGLA